MALLTFESFSVMWCTKWSLLSKKSPTWLCTCILLTCDPWSRILGWFIFEGFIEKAILLVWFELLRDIFYWYVHLEIVSRSSLNLINESFGSWIIENRDVSSAKRLTLYSAEPRVYLRTPFTHVTVNLDYWPPSPHSGGWGDKNFWFWQS